MVRRQHGNSQEHVTKHIFVTGGVVSSLGKGLTASSLGRLLRSRGIKVLQQKLDPYINVDPGTMNPFQHGEVYVTEDGAETDLDIGHYERFLDVYLSQKANVTTGQIYQEVLRKERAGEYLGQCVQVIPHITNEIKSRMRAQASDDVDVIITEIGGTVGDIESQPFLEAAREVRRDLGAENCMFVHVSLVPYIAAAHELKTKPTQHSVMMLRQLGISPDALVLRSDRPLNQSIKDMISLMCDVDSEGVVNCVDAPSIYDVPKTLFDEGLDAYVVRELGLPFHDVDWDEWEDLLERVHHPKHEVNVAIVGKYIDLPDAYLSVTEAIKAGGFANWAKVNVKWVAADKCATEEGAAAALDQVDGIVIPGRLRHPWHRRQDRRPALRPRAQAAGPRPVPRSAVHGHRIRTRCPRHHRRELLRIRSGLRQPGHRHHGRAEGHRRRQGRHGSHHASGLLPGGTGGRLHCRRTVRHHACHRTPPPPLRGERGIQGSSARRRSGHLRPEP